MPALFHSTSMWPNSDFARSYMSRTCCSSVTSAWIARSPAAPSARSTPTTRAPSRANTCAASAPMPLAVPVITQTFPSSRPAISPLLGRVEDVLDVGVVLDRVGTELAPAARLLEAAERGCDANGAVGVDRQHAGVDRARHAQRLGAVTRPDRAGQPV